jgi:hypothetical protein
MIHMCEIMCLCRLEAQDPKIRKLLCATKYSRFATSHLFEGRIIEMKNHICK